MTSAEREEIAVYRDRIAEEIVHALGFSRWGTMRRCLSPFFRLPAGRFAAVIARADRETRTSGLGDGSRRLMADLSLEPAVRGAEKIPLSGPLLLASNHPGAYDSVAIMACVRRSDLKVVLSDVALSRAFSSARRYFIFAPPGTAGRALALRASIDHLKSGRALLIFPHTEVEPDPEISPGAMPAIEDWSRSLEIMLRRVPESRLQVTMASGVLLPRFLHHPLVKIRRSAAKRQKLAEVMQICRQIISPRGVRPEIHLTFGTPVQGRDVLRDGGMPAVIGMARRLLEDHMASVRRTRGDGGRGV